jgi:hypothetical protein
MASFVGCYNFGEAAISSMFLVCFVALSYNIKQGLK